MATAPAQTFQEFDADPDIAAEVAAANVPVTGRVKRDLGAVVGGLIETLFDVNSDDTQRNALINNNNLLKGVIMGPDGPMVSSMELIVRPNDLLVTVNQNGKIQTTTAEAEFTQSLMTSLYTSAAVKVAAPYVTANANYSKETSYKNTTTQKTVLVSSRYMFPQGEVNLNPPILGVVDPVQLNPSFTAAITSALGQSSQAARREALDTVFNTYGHVFRTRLLLGGALSAHTMNTFDRSEDETTVKKDIKSALELAVKQWGFSGSSGHGSTSTSVTTKQGRTVSVNYIVNGGDYTLIKDTDQWITSTTQPANWRVVQVTETVAVVDMLPAAVRDQVKTLMTPLLGKWVTAMIDPDVPPTSTQPVYLPLQPIPSGWFFLGWSSDGTQALIVKPTLAAKTGRNLAVVAAKNSSSTPPTAAAPINGYQFAGSYIKSFDVNSSPGNQYGALRPGLVLEGNWKPYGASSGSYYSWVIHPNAPAAPEDDCFDLSTIAGQQSSDGSIPLDRFVLRKNAVLLNSGET